MFKNQKNGTCRKALNKKEVRIIIEMEEISQFDIIEEMISRFPKLAQDIFKDLDDKSLKNCLKVSREWSKFILNEKFPWERYIQSIRRNYKLGFDKHWDR